MALRKIDKLILAPYGHMLSFYPLISQHNHLVAVLFKHANKSSRNIYYAIVKTQ